MVLLCSTRRAEAFAERALAHAARRRLARPFAVVGVLSAVSADVELHSSAPFAVLEDLRRSVDQALAVSSFTHGAIVYEGARSPETSERLLVADVLEPGRPWVLRFATRGLVLERIGAIRVADWP